MSLLHRLFTLVRTAVHQWLHAEEYDLSRRWAGGLAALAATVGGLIVVPVWVTSRVQPAQTAQTSVTRETLEWSERATTLFPLAPDAWERAALHLELAGNVQALALRQHALARADENQAARLRLDLAASALRFRELDTAEATLAQVPGKLRSDPRFQVFSYALASVRGWRGLAEVRLAALASPPLSPESAAFHRAWGRMLLTREGEDDLSGSLARLGQTPGPHQAEALRERTLILAARRQRGAALAAATQLVTLPAARASDLRLGERLRRLTQPAAPDATPTGPTTEEFLPQDSAAALEQLYWTTFEAGPEAAHRWFTRLPATLTSDPALRAADLDLRVLTEERETMRHALAQGAWGTLNPEALAQAFAARAASERSQGDLRRIAWERAVTLAGADHATLQALVRLATLWQLPDETLAALQACTRAGNARDWAFREWLALAGRDDAAGVADLARRWQEASPAERAPAFLRARALALLESRTGTEQALALARTARATDPADLRWTALEARLLGRTGDPQTALRLLETLPAADLREPELAFAYGLVLLQADFPVTARRHLELVPRAGLWPGERMLLDNALATYAESTALHP